ncbi:MAG: ATP synthase F1 subunit gamma [Bacteroidales bacterium]|nr:ATP synthase F1 subunit gamma [Bacteroidota bacterium]MBL6950625.1 ATP synthase F1 subunit gamma [Bacteroidales bacterium]
MAGLKEVRIRIASVKSTEQITNAMKMVAASKLRRAQNSILKLRPYAAKLREIMQNLSASAEDSNESGFAEVRKPERILLVVLTSNRGLCGAFNSNVIKAASQRIHETYKIQFENQAVDLITAGKKATDYFRKRKYNVVESWDEIYDSLTFETVAPLAEKLMQFFTDKSYDRIEIIYNQFKNASVQRLMTEQFLPVEPEEIPEQTNLKKVESDYIFEPDKETILYELIPKTLRIQLFKAILDSYAAEMGARMTAMQQATENAKEILKELRISYNKARQNQITREIIEIVSGAEALKG